MSDPLLFHVDAFTTRPFAGNPAAVVLIESEPSVEWMQAVGNEMQLSETAFTWPARDGVRGLRWFTPTVEVDLCGHATLATAHVLWSEGIDAAERLEFDTASGRLSCARAEGGAVTLDFPIDVPSAVATPDALRDGLGVPIREVLRGKFDHLVRVEDAATVRALAPDLALIAAVGGRGVCVTAPGDGGVDFVSRFFGPAVGIAEDPATGSAHCMLAPYWAGELGRDEFEARQVSARGGELYVHIAGDRVLLTGHAVTVTRGTIAAP